MKLAGVALAAGLSMIATSSRAADIVLLDMTLTGRLFPDVIVDTPTPGKYKVEVSASAPTSQFEVHLQYENDWAVYFAPPPKPVGEYIAGNNLADTDEVYHIPNGTLYYFVPDTSYTFFTSDAYYADWYGVPLGTPLYRADTIKNAYIRVFGENLEENPLADLTYHVRITQMGIPEPATWALMIGGFGATGVALRRRRTATFDT